MKKEEEQEEEGEEESTYKLANQFTYFPAFHAT